MKVSGFTFIRNGQSLGFPFIQSIQSILPLCDEFVVNVGESQDDTLAQLQALNEPKIKIYQSHWNDAMRDKGYVYGQQKMIAQFLCQGDWLFYLEADEIVHEKDHQTLYNTMTQHHKNSEVEALVFDYYHFYGNLNTYAWSPAWYRRAPRIIKASARSYAPDGLYWVVLDQKKNKRGRMPRAALTTTHMYHYGWVRPQEKMQNKITQVAKYWGHDNAAHIDYCAIDQKSLRHFQGEHPALIQGFFQEEEGIFQANPQHVLTRREKKHRLSMCLERWFNLDLSRKHFTLMSK